MGKLYRDQKIARKCYFVSIKHLIEEQEGMKKATDDPRGKKPKVGETCHLSRYNRGPWKNLTQGPQRHPAHTFGRRSANCTIKVSNELYKQVKDSLIRLLREYKAYLPLAWMGC